MEPVDALAAQLQDPETLLRAAKRGVQLCRSEATLEEGFALLKAVANAKLSLELPAAFYSYLGFGLAGFEGQYRAGVKLCQRAIEMEFFQPEHYLNLGRTYMLLGSRRKAVKALQKGLEVDRTYAPLHRFYRNLGRRKKPVLPFLPRNSGPNRVLGRLRHQLTGKPEAPEAESA